MLGLLDCEDEAQKSEKALIWIIHTTITSTLRLDRVKIYPCFGVDGVKGLKCLMNSPSKGLLP